MVDTSLIINLNLRTIRELKYQFTFRSFEMNPVSYTHLDVYKRQDRIVETALYDLRLKVLNLTKQS